MKIEDKDNIQKEKRNQLSEKARIKYASDETKKSQLICLYCLLILDNALSVDEDDFISFMWIYDALLHANLSGIH